MHLHIRVEGTAAEISDVLRVLPGAATVRTAAVELTDEVAQSAVSADRPEAESRFVTIRFARRALKRRKLSKPMRDMLRALYEAHPNWLSQESVRAASGYGPSQYAGLMGAFGRRLVNTEGYDAEVEFFESEWDDDGETWNYRLPDTVCEALAVENLV